MTGDKADMSAVQDATSTSMNVDAKLLEILVCPVTKAPLQYDSARQELVSRAAGLAYPIRDGVPLMTQEAARPLDSAK
jgi:uncharacterized protein YbaR (Trm112 family)